ncbi:Rv0361 family membrane protein [Gordonia sp. NPDC003424]
MTFPPPGHFPPPPTGPGQPGYPQQPYGPGPYPMGPAPFGPQPPRRPRGTGRLVAVGVLSAVVIFALLVLVGYAMDTSDDDTVATPTTGPSTSGVVPPTTAPDGTASNGSEADLAGIRAAMQKFVDAVNARNVQQIQAAVCTQVRPQVIKPVDITGNVVFEGLGKVTVTGDSAQSQVITHLEVGARRSTSKQEDESFVRENGTWFVCPGAEPDIGT